MYPTYRADLLRLMPELIDSNFTHNSPTSFTVELDYDSHQTLMKHIITNNLSTVTVTSLKRKKESLYLISTD